MFRISREFGDSPTSGVQWPTDLVSVAIEILPAPGNDLATQHLPDGQIEGRLFQGNAAEIQAAKLLAFKIDCML
jgi:hypothetical protein